MSTEFVTSVRDTPAVSLIHFLSKAKENIVLFSPFVKSSALKALLRAASVDVTLITRLSERDVIMGVSDPDLFPVCKEYGAKILVNNQIHLKAYVTDWSAIFLGSSNLTSRGLGFAKTGNYELNIIEDKLQLEARNYLQEIINSSVEMDEDLFERFSKSIAEMPQPKMGEDRCLIDYLPRKTHLISELPMSRTVEDFYQSYSADFCTGMPITDVCAQHDAQNFNLPNGLARDEFLKILRKEFFKNAFVSDLLAYIDEEPRYFGAVKAWIQQNCDDVPVPSRRDLTGNIQVLYKWISSLSEGGYEVDRPNYSERIRKMGPS